MNCQIAEELETAYDNGSITLMVGWVSGYDKELRFCQWNLNNPDGLRDFCSHYPELGKGYVQRLAKNNV